MIYDNCIKYIDKELKRNLIDKEWKQKYFLIYGLDSLGKTVYMLLKEYKVSKLEYYDSSIYNKEWAQNECVKNVNNAIEETLRDNGFIIVCNKTDKIKITELIKEINPIYNKNIVDLSGIRMNKMPNPILPTQYEKYADLKECHNVLMDILNAFCDFCDKHNLRYFLDYGTLLGAVRHKGFIPWDDDLDVCMPVPDYLVFKDLFPRDGDFFLDSVFNDQVRDLSPSNLLKIKSKKIIIEFNHFPLRTMAGLGLDVFPLCGYPSDKNEQEKYLSDYMKWSNIWKEKVVIPYGTKYYSREKHIEIFQEMQKIITRYDYETAEFIAPAYFERDTFLSCGDNRIMPKEWYESAIKMKFENRELNVPKGYDSVLSKWYGDYMILPSEESRNKQLATKRYMITNFEMYK